MQDDGIAPDAVQLLVICGLRVRLLPHDDAGLFPAHARSRAQLHPLVLPQVLHFMQVPLRTSVKFPHVPQASPS